MKNYLKALGIMVLASSLSYGEEAPEKAAKPKPDPEKMFKKLDADSSGSISLDEFKASPRGQKDPVKAEEAYKKMDADSKDGVSLEEFKAAGPAPGKGKKKEAAPEE